MSVRNILLAAGGSADDKLYVDDVFSTYLRTGTGADAVVNTGIDMTKGYMLWSKGRSGATDHAIYDSARGPTYDLAYDLASNTTAAQTTQATGLRAVSATGHTIGSLAKMNTSAAAYVDFVFRKAPKFFDVVTWTGNATNRTIAHALGQEVGLIFVKRTDTTADWQVYHRSLANTEYMVLNSTAAKATGATRWNSTTPTSAVFSLGTDASVNAVGGTYVAYLFAHDPSADGIVQCGSYTGNGGSPLAVTLGWEPQFLLVKNVSAGGSGIVDWVMLDTARGINTGSADSFFRANTAEKENTGNDFLRVTPTGFQLDGPNINNNPQTYIYLAIRRPNKPPTTGTEVYNSVIRTSTSNGGDATLSVGFPADTALIQSRDEWGANFFTDRLRGVTNQLTAHATNAEVSNSSYGVVKDFGMTHAVIRELPNTRKSVNHFFKRAPGFFDVVCYTGNYTGSNAPLIPHNLGVKPELLIQKKRSGSMAMEWYVLSDIVPGTGVSRYSILDGTSTFQGVSGFLAPTSAGFPALNAADPCVAYLFTSLPGISKVGSYTGNGTTQTINCGFTTGARFILIKRTNNTGDWYVWDTARGVVAGNDPHLSLNTTAAEVTTNDSIDPDASGFIVNQVDDTHINVSDAQYIFLAIA